MVKNEVEMANLPKRLAELKKEAEACEDCPLSKTRKNVVFGEGNIRADIMFVGEGPGQVEDETGHAFVGRSGQLLDKMFKDVGINRKNVYIANIVKCRVPNNADPSVEYRLTCIKYLREQVKIVKPKIIVCLGRIAATTIIDPNFKITKEHGIWYNRKNFFMMATYHPSALLRNPDLMKDAQNDFKILIDKYNEIKK